MIIVHRYASAILLISNDDDPGRTAVQTDDPRAALEKKPTGTEDTAVAAQDAPGRHLQRRTRRSPLRPPTRLIDCRTVRPPRVSI